MNNADMVKESYIRFQGSTSHMAREDNAAYERYLQLNPGEDLLDFYCDDYDNLNAIGWNNIVDRHLNAVNDYVRAYKKYGKLNLSTF